MTALLKQAVINEHRNTIAHLPLMGRTERATHRAVVVADQTAQARVMKTALVVS